MLQRMKPVVAIATAVFLLVIAGRVPAQDCPTEPVRQNFTGDSTTACPCFNHDEEAGAVFSVPSEHYPIEVLRIGVGWGSLHGDNPAQIEQALHIYNGRLPDPGTPVFTMPGPSMTGGVINEFDIETLGNVIIESAPVTATIQFRISNLDNVHAPTLVHDGNGCQDGMNLIKAVPGGWLDACDTGVTGDWVFSLTYRQIDCRSKADDREYTVTSAPLRPKLNDCYPNPFNPQTLISFDMPAPGKARLEVYSLAGKRVITLVDGEVGAGRHQEIWYGRDGAGRPVPSGVYFYRLQAEGFSDSKRMVLLK